MYIVYEGICLCYREIKLKSEQRYTIGKKRCQVCQIFINCQGPCSCCCGYRYDYKYLLYVTIEKTHNYKNIIYILINIKQ
jgi:hypothetical protein